MAELALLNENELIDKLDEGIVNFAFKKRNNNLRIACGTRNLSLIPTQHHPKGKRGPANVISYFDINKQGWRGIGKESDIFKM